MNYIINLSCKVSAENADEARTQALMKIQVREAGPMVLLPLNVFELLKEYRGKKKEYFIALLLDTQNAIIRQEIISVGTLNASLIHPREVFEPAIKHLASHIIVSHNHPSGSLEPSSEDLNVTRRLQDAGKIIGISLVDHVIITKDNYFSLKEHNLM